MSVETKESLKKFVVDMMVKYSTNEEIIHQSKYLLSKINKIFVKIVKEELPNNWTEVIDELTEAAKTNQLLCENNLAILKMISEEVFEFGKLSTTRAKLIELRNYVNSNCGKIFSLCEHILSHCGSTNLRPSLIINTLQCLASYVAWCPWSMLLSSNTLGLLFTLFSQGGGIYRLEILRCWTEILSLRSTGSREEEESFLLIGEKVIDCLYQIDECLLTGEERKPEERRGEERRGRAEMDERVWSERLSFQIALLLLGYYKNHLACTLVSLPPSPLVESQWKKSLRFVSFCMKNREMQIYKATMEYVHQVCVGLLQLKRIQSRSDKNASPDASPLDLGDDRQDLGQSMKRQLYTEISSLYELFLKKSTASIISCFAKPEQVRIAVDEFSGEIYKTETKDTEEISLFNLQKETLQYIAHIIPIYVTDYITQGILTESTAALRCNNYPCFSGRIPEQEWNSVKFNYYCRATAALGSLPKDVIDDKGFFMENLKQLLTLCEKKTGKEYRAIIAGNVMYIVSQYPRFLKKQHSFFVIVLNKLMEFCTEPFPGVKDMALDTLVEMAEQLPAVIANYLVESKTSGVPYLASILFGKEELERERRERRGETREEEGGGDGNSVVFRLIENHLTPQQTLVLLEYLGTVIHAVSDGRMKEAYIDTLTGKIKGKWMEMHPQLVMGNLWERGSGAMELLGILSQLLRMLTAIAKKVGLGLLPMMEGIFQSLLQSHHFVAEELLREERKGEAGEVDERRRGHEYHAMKTAMKHYKRCCLRLIEAFLLQSGIDLSSSSRSTIPSLAAYSSSEQKKIISSQILAPLLQPILQDYVNNKVQLKDPETLNIFNAIVQVYKNDSVAIIQNSWETLFDDSLLYLSQDLSSYPDLRLSFFTLAHSIVEHAFDAFFQLSSHFIEKVIQIFIFGIQHSYSEVSVVALESLSLFVCQLHQYLKYGKMPVEHFRSFYRIYYYRLLEILMAMVVDINQKNLTTTCLNIIRSLIGLSLEDILMEFASVRHLVHQDFINQLHQKFSCFTPEELTSFIAAIIQNVQSESQFADTFNDFTIEYNARV